MKEALEGKKTSKSSSKRTYSIGRGEKIPTKDSLESILSMHKPGGTLANAVVLRFTLKSRGGESVFTYILDKKRYPVDTIKDVQAFKAHLRRYAEITKGWPV